MNKLPLALNNLISFMRHNHYTLKDINIDKLAYAFNLPQEKIVEFIISYIKGARHMNSVCISGRLTHDIEIKTTNSGHKVTTFTVAVRKNNEKTSFIECVAWNKTAEFIEKYFKKGSCIEVEGTIETGNYTTKTDNRKIKITEIVVRNAFFSGKKEN